MRNVIFTKDWDFEKLEVVAHGSLVDLIKLKIENVFSNDEVVKIFVDASSITIRVFVSDGVLLMCYMYNRITNNINLMSFNRSDIKNMYSLFSEVDVCV